MPAASYEPRVGPGRGGAIVLSSCAHEATTIGCLGHLRVHQSSRDNISMLINQSSGNNISILINQSSGDNISMLINP